MVNTILMGAVVVYVITFAYSIFMAYVGWKQAKVNEKNLHEEGNAPEDVDICAGKHGQDSDPGKFQQTHNQTEDNRENKCRDGYRERRR